MFKYIRPSRSWCDLFLCLVIPMCRQHLVSCLFTMKQEILVGACLWRWLWASSTLELPLAWRTWGQLTATGECSTTLSSWNISLRRLRGGGETWSAVEMGAGPHSPIVIVDALALPLSLLPWHTHTHTELWVCSVHIFVALNGSESRARLTLQEFSDSTSSQWKRRCRWAESSQ